MATAQINARIDADVKARGDQALSSIGYSPTRIIRAVWEFAGKNANNRKALRAWAESLEGETAKAQRDADLKAWEEKLAEGPRIVERALREMGVDPENYTPIDFSSEEAFEDLRAEALYEKWTERGLI